MTSRSQVAVMVVLAGALLGCHELGNPVTRTTQATPFPSEAPHETITHVTYAHSSEAVAWRRAPAHTLDRDLPSARYIARIAVEHPALGGQRGRVQLVTTIAFADGRTRTVQWAAPSDESPWLLDLALAASPTRAITRIVRR
ncbi:MAG: hypothetical protein KC593_11515 [Myxococcales bacterium]|nr:hypothetical protein [Myxococcales bacterium]MCB9627241.1 hypothetical protein [Sandaracinaceae bacterium]